MTSIRRNLTFWLVALGFFTVTWDLLLTIPLGGFHLKIYQAFFLLAFGSAFLWESRAELFRPLGTPFAKVMALLWVYYLGTSPWSAFPLKSAFYAIWLGFEIVCVWLPVQLVANSRPREHLVRVAAATLVFHSVVILIDHVAYRFGYIGGFIGNNQDILLHWGASRPHAFASEPSYIAAFLSLGLVTIGASWFTSGSGKALAAVGILITVVAIVVTTSRTGLANLGLGTLLLLLTPILAGRRVSWRVIALPPVLIILGIAVLLLTTPERQRKALDMNIGSGMLHGNDGSTYARLKIHLTAIRFANETHWVGTGLGASYRYFLDHGGVDITDPKAREHFGNELIMSTWGQLIAEGGALATLLYLAAAVTMVGPLFRRWKQDFDLLALGAFAAALIWFAFDAFWLGNICRGDVWVWFGVWAAAAAPALGNRGGEGWGLIR